MIIFTFLVLSKSFVNRAPLNLAEKALYKWNIIIIIDSVVFRPKVCIRKGVRVVTVSVKQ